jgi:hypothetical protein
MQQGGRFLMAANKMAAALKTYCLREVSPESKGREPIKQNYFVIDASFPAQGFD